MKKTLKKYQRRALHFINRHKGCAGVFMDCGTGKTLVAIRYAMKFLPALIVCRRDDFLTWETELEEEEFDMDRVRFIQKGNHDICTLFNELFDNEVDWVFMPYDLVKNKSIKSFVDGTKWGVCIADESHMIKRWKSTRTKRLIAATKHVPRNLALTGTPLTNDLLDIFSQGLFINGGKTFGKKEWNFRNRYFIKPPNFPGWVPKRGAKDEIKRRLKELAFYIDIDDVLKLPNQRTIVKGVPMTGVQRKYHDQILKEWELTIDGKTCDIDHVIVQLSKLRQIAGGFLYRPDHSPMYIRNKKIDLLKDMVTSTQYFGENTKIVIWCSHTAEILKIAEVVESINDKCVTFYGSKSKEKNLARQEFKKNPKIRFFIGQVDAGVGINELVVSNVGIYYSNSFKVLSKTQSKKRIRRMGSGRHKHITYCELVTEKSIDLHILKCLKSNIDIASYILTKIKQRNKLGDILK